jgi:hypothetical protein
MEDEQNMYPMNELVLFIHQVLQFFDKLNKLVMLLWNSLENVCSIAMAAYRDPELKGIC